VWADTAREVAGASEIVFSIVGYPADVREVALGSEGVLAGSSTGSIYVDMTTSDPTLASDIYRAAEARGVAAIDAPVSGGDVGARSATLSIMVGGDTEAVDRVRPLLGVMGETVVHQGGPGAGQHTKLVNQILIATGMIGVCEALVYGYRAGLDLERVMESVASGAAGSWSLTNYGPRMLSGDFAPGFVVDHFVKDMGIALDEARRARLSLPGLALAEQLYVALQAQGAGRLGTHSLVLAIASLSDVDWRDR
jgi:3-hydroxyisobutyrate dehydrogenase